MTEVEQRCLKSGVKKHGVDKEEIESGYSSQEAFIGEQATNEAVNGSGDHKKTELHGLNRSFLDQLKKRTF